MQCMRVSLKREDEDMEGDLEDHEELSNTMDGAVWLGEEGDMLFAWAERRRSFDDFYVK